MPVSLLWFHEPYSSILLRVSLWKDQTIATTGRVGPDCCIVWTISICVGEMGSSLHKRCTERENDPGMNGLWDDPDTMEECN